MALMTGLSALTGGLANTQAARTGKYGQSSSSSSSGGTKRVVTPEQQAVFSPLVQNILQRLENPQAALQPAHTAARESVNQNFAGMDDVIRQKYGTGAGASGKYGKAARVGEQSRLSALSGVDGQFAAARTGVQEGAAQQGLSLLGMNFGQEYQQGQSNQSSGFNTAPGSAASGALTSGATMLGSQQTELFRNLFLLQQLTGGL